jgi:hypothetical protein
MHWGFEIAPLGPALFLALWRGCRALLASFVILYAFAFGLHEASKRPTDPVLHDLYQSGLTRAFLSYAARSLGSVLVLELFFGSSVPRCVAFPISQLVVIAFTATHTHGVSHLDRIIVIVVAAATFGTVLFRGDKVRRSVLYLAWVAVFFAAQGVNASPLVWNILIFAAVWSL